MSYHDSENSGKGGDGSYASSGHGGGDESYSSTQRDTSFGGDTVTHDSRGGIGDDSTYGTGTETSKYESGTTSTAHGYETGVKPSSRDADDSYDPTDTTGMKSDSNASGFGDSEGVEYASITKPSSGFDTGAQDDDISPSARRRSSGSGRGGWGNQTSSYGGSGETSSDSTAGKLMEKAGSLLHSSKLEQQGRVKRANAGHAEDESTGD